MFIYGLQYVHPAQVLTPYRPDQGRWSFQPARGHIAHGRRPGAPLTPFQRINWERLAALIINLAAWAGIVGLALCRLPHP
ncbi:hypothetical protein [Phenylobacterium montanum]|uniref:Uncharacterized protein n=1 Tax=Phenylobacterium montanum TaxID=2823693 RepID=A0A975FWC9_9CAUL|nr:hypothetical protein [Caulobacter sp. S6]QUD86479.1 hypothetical protein KCG34_15425 [Caulobacter sp. S6]